MAVSRIVARSSLAALATLLGCSAASSEESDQLPQVVRIAAGRELFTDGLEPRERLTNTVSYVYDLLYKDASKELSVVNRSGSAVTLKRRPGSEWTLEDLAASLRFAGLSAAKVMPNGQIRALFSSEERAVAFAGSRTAGLATGRYQAVVGDSVIRLVPTEANRPVLELVPTNNDDAWRLLAGRQIDVVPDIGPLNADHLRDIGSITIHELDTSTFMGLVFNLHSDAVRAPAVRRAVAAAARHSAVAEVACGRGCAMQLPGLTNEPEVADAPAVEVPRISLLVLGTQVENVVAGHALAHAIWTRTDVRPALEEISIKQLADRLRDGRFDAMLVPCPTDARTLYERFLPSGNYGSLGYESADFSAAVDRNDWARAAADIRRDAVLVPLWQYRRYAAVDESICGARPSKPTSWHWLADLHPCRPGEKPL